MQLKKILMIALIALLIGGAIEVSYAVSESGPGYAGDVMGMATGRYESDPHRTFRLVRRGAASTSVWTSASALTAGQLVIWDTTANPYGADGVSVTTSTTSNDSRVAGMIITAVPTRDASTASIQGTLPVTTASEDVGLANWGWLQTYGKSAEKATVGTGVGTVTVGSAVSCSSTAGSIGPFVASSSAATANGNAGFAYETMTGGNTGYIFLKCD